MFEWISSFVLFYLIVRNYFDNRRITRLETLVRYIEIQLNKNEMNVNQLYFFRQTELVTKDATLAPDYVSDLRKELDHANALLADRNRVLLEEVKNTHR